MLFVLILLITNALFAESKKGNFFLFVLLNHALIVNEEIQHKACMQKSDNCKMGVYLKTTRYFLDDNLSLPLELDAYNFALKLNELKKNP